MSNPPAFKASSLLTVSGAKYNNRRSFDDSKGTSNIPKNDQPSMGLIGTTNMTNPNLSYAQSQQQQQPRSDQITSDLLAKGLYSSSANNDALSKTNSFQNAQTASTNTNSNANNVNNNNNATTEVKYWKYPNSSDNAHESKEDMVVIHVCDENQQVSKDFSCKRDILVQHMRYFQKFLNETENGYDDIDISVHCDVEIFEWLMNYIHDTANPPKMDKSILISILISSEFLQMDPLVDLCIGQVATSLNDIIKLPIDLSCISEKLVNRIAAISSPKALSEIKDRKDKILTKLYKRRVELDFSRKGSASKSISASVNGGIVGLGGSSTRTIAASLTCCRYCGWVYLENYSAFLTCRKSPPSIDHRGRLASRHSAIQGWSLTSYLKTLHSGGMGWDAIYWHVWAACIVLRVEDIVISALETDRYGVEPDGLLIKCVSSNPAESVSDGTSTTSSWINYKSSIRTSNTTGGSDTTKGMEYNFSLDMDMDSILSGTVQSPTTTTLDTSNWVPSLKLYVSPMSPTSPNSYAMNNSNITPTLNPHRPPEVLTLEIYELICSQMKYITGLQHKALITNTMQTIVTNAAKADALANSTNSTSNIHQELQAIDDEDTKLYYGGLPSTANNNASGNNNTGDFLTNDEKRRGRSPARGLARLFSVSQEPRNGSTNASGGSTKATRRSSTVGPALPSQPKDTSNNTPSSGATTVAGAGAGAGNSSDNETPYDSDADTPRNSGGAGNATGGNGGSGAGGSGSGAGVAGTGKAKGTTRYHSHHPQQPQQGRVRSLSSTGKRSTTSNASNVSSLTSGSMKQHQGLPPKGRQTLTNANHAAGAAGSGAGKSAVSSEIDGQQTGEEEEADTIPRLHRILTSMPPDLYHRAQQHQKGALYGVWLQPCALTWQPPALEEMLCVVEDSHHLPEHKKLEWQLDLMREYDEKRMDKLERWLVSKRNPVFDTKPSASMTTGTAAGKGTIASKARFGNNGQFYYKERMRFPYKCVI